MDASSSGPGETFECEGRIRPFDAYLCGALGVFLSIGGMLSAISYDAPYWAFLMFQQPALLLFVIATRLYRGRGKLIFRIVGDGKRLIILRKHEQVTIGFDELTRVEYDTRSDSPVMTAFYLASGRIACLGPELVNHGPLLAYLRGAFPGEMTYNGRTITSPDQVPQD